MAEETALESLNLVTGEGVPRALQAATHFEEGVATIATRLDNFKLDCDVTIDIYKQEMDEILRTAELKLDDTANRLQVFLKKLSAELDEKESVVSETIETKQGIFADFQSASEGVDQQLDGFGTELDVFQTSAEGVYEELSGEVQEFQTIATELSGKVQESLDGYKEMHADAARNIAEAVSEGTESVLEMMTNLSDMTEGKLAEYENMYGEVLDVLSGDSEKQAEVFSSAIDQVDKLTGGLSEDFMGSVGDVTEKLNSIGEMIETIKPILDFIDELV